MGLKNFIGYLVIMTASAVGICSLLLFGGFLFGASFKTRDSLDEFDYDRWSVFLGIDTRLGRSSRGILPSGSSEVDHRGPPGGSDPEVEGEIDPGGGG